MAPVAESTIDNWVLEHRAHPANTGRDYEQGTQYVAQQHDPSSFHNSQVGTRRDAMADSAARNTVVAADDAEMAAADAVREEANDEDVVAADDDDDDGAEVLPVAAVGCNTADVDVVVVVAADADELAIVLAW